MAPCGASRTQLLLSKRWSVPSRDQFATNGSGRAMSRLCACRKEASSSLSPCVWIPRHRFASSRFNTAVLLILRLFYQASSFDLGGPRSRSVSTAKEVPFNGNTWRADAGHHMTDCQQNIKTPLDFFSAYERLSTVDWRARALSHSEQFSTYEVVSMTWVKALASPFSHEFIQFIVEDSKTGQRTRIAVGREETGDWVICGWNWTSGDPPSPHYTLPLPLLSLVFHASKRPDMGAISRLLAKVSEKKPDYNLIREMCWWYAETIFEEMNSRYGGSIKEWKWSKYRYSFIVKTGIFRRKVLTEHAKDFRYQIANEMQY